jgi:hypothetical protein
MRKQLIVLGASVLIVLMCITGCLETKTIDVPLDTVALTLDDLGGDFEKFNENHTTEPYVVEKGLLLEGWRVLEKYEVRFSSNESSILQTLAKFESEEKCRELIDYIRSNFSEEFTEIDNEAIGDRLYFGVAPNVSENQSLYFLVFTVKNIAVILFGTADLQATFVNYAKIIEDNINAALTNT